MSETTKCHKCGCTDRRLFHHHRSYEPEEIVMVCMSCHRKLHFELRKNGQCTIPPARLTEMSNKSDHAQKRKNKHYLKHMDMYKKRAEDHRDSYKLYNLVFNESMMPNIRLRERIGIIDDGKSINVLSFFDAMHGKKLVYIDLD